MCWVLQKRSKSVRAGVEKPKGGSTFQQWRYLQESGIQRKIKEGGERERERRPVYLNQINSVQKRTE